VGALSRTARNRNAFAYLSAVLISAFGSSAMMLVAGVWVMDLTGSAESAAWVSFVVWAPTLAGPVIGALVDRLPQRRLAMVFANVAVGFALLLLLPIGSASQVWLIFAVMLVYGIGFAVLDAAETAVLPAAVPAELLGDVNGLRMSASEGMKLVAPLAGAGLFAWLGGAAVAGLDALTFAVAALLCLAIRPRPIPYTLKNNGVAEGGRQLWRHRALRRIVFSGAAVMFAAGMGGVTVFAIVDQGLHRSATFAGVLAAAQGAGSIAGGLLAGPLLRKVNPRVFTGVSILLVGATLALRSAPALPLVLTASLLNGLGLPWVLITAFTTVQREIPAEYLGRVGGTVNTVLFVPNAAGQAAGAALLSATGYRSVLLVSAAVALAASVVCLRRGVHLGLSTEDAVT
jgi:MFS family permease